MTIPMPPPEKRTLRDRFDHTRVGVLWNAITGPLPIAEIAPKGVKLILSDGRSFIPVMVKLPRRTLTSPTVWIAYGPPSVGEFDNCRIECESMSRNDTLMVALMQTWPLNKCRFAPIPLDMVERSALTNGYGYAALVAPPPPEPTQ